MVTADRLKILLGGRTTRCARLSYCSPQKLVNHGAAMNLNQHRTWSGFRFFMLTFAGIFAAFFLSASYAADPLQSWNDGAAKTAILEFVAAVTEKGNKDYVDPSRRIATFDNDGTLWVEYPMYTQFLFAFDRIKTLAPQHPEWKTTQPFQAVLEGDMKTVGASGMKGLMELIMATHSGMTAAEFEKTVLDWLGNTRQDRFKRLYTELIYQPQLELLAYLRANGFKTFIVSGGGIAFMRPITEKAYGIPPEQVVGSSVVAEFQDRDGKASAGSPTENRLHQRQGGQTCGYLPTHRSPPDPGLW